MFLLFSLYSRATACYEYFIRGSLPPPPPAQAVGSLLLFSPLLLPSVPTAHESCQLFSRTHRSLALLHPSCSSPSTAPPQHLIALFLHFCRVIFTISKRRCLTLYHVHNVTPSPCPQGLSARCHCRCLTLYHVRNVTPSPCPHGLSARCHFHMISCLTPQF